MPRPPQIPAGPRAIQKGVSLTTLLDREAVECMALNVQYAYAQFDTDGFIASAMEGLEPLKVMERGRHIGQALQKYLPEKYTDATDLLIGSMAGELTSDEEFGMAPFFYLPYSFFIADFGIDPQFNGGDDPFELSMKGLHELTRRFTAEFAIRPFLIADQNRTLNQVKKWMADSNSHVRRLCSEGTRPKLPWGIRLKSFIADPAPLLPILEGLKDDVSLYVRRSVANHLGDIAKDHLDLVFEVCERWLEGAVSDQRKWVIRHALRHPAKKGVDRALEIRLRAGARKK